MTMRILIFSALLGVSGQVWAQSHAVTGKIGMLGLGVEYGYAVSERLTLRAGLNGGSIGFDAEESGIDYAFDFKWDSLLAAVDFHPFAGAFRLYGGLLRNDNTLLAASTPTAPINIGGTLYAPEEIGVLTGTIGFDSTAPFLGLGWDWSRYRRVGVTLDIGLLSQGTPRAALRASEGLISDPQFAADIATEQQELQDALDDLDLLPFVTLGVTFRF